MLNSALVECCTTILGNTVDASMYRGCVLHSEGEYILVVAESGGAINVVDFVEACCWVDGVGLDASSFWLGRRRLAKPKVLLPVYSCL
jgi:hypothetical protein